jgi:hypothetical protein
MRLSMVCSLANRGSCLGFIANMFSNYADDDDIIAPVNENSSHFAWLIEK